jgi:hypothetical protein
MVMLTKRGGICGDANISNIYSQIISLMID